MTTAAETRRSKARGLAAEIGGVAQFAKAMGMSDSQASQIIGENPTRNIGARLARRIEGVFKKAVGWLDLPAMSEFEVKGDTDRLSIVFSALLPEQRQEIIDQATRLAEQNRRAYELLRTQAEPAAHIHTPHYDGPERRSATIPVALERRRPSGDVGPGGTWTKGQSIAEAIRKSDDLEREKRKEGDES